MKNCKDSQSAWLTLWKMQNLKNSMVSQSTHLQYRLIKMNEDEYRLVKINDKDQ